MNNDLKFANYIIYVVNYVRKISLLIIQKDFMIKITSEIYTNYEIPKYKGLRVARFESNLGRNSEKMEYTRFQGPLP